MSESTVGSEDEDADVGAGSLEDSKEPLDEDDYALGRTSEPDGAEREEPAGEDYAGSGF